MKILFLSSWFPYPAINGSKLRILHILRGLAEVHDVTLVSFTRDDRADVEGLQQYIDDVHVIPWQGYNPDSARARKGFLSKTPRSLVDTHSEQMATCIRTLCEQQTFDLVIASQLTMASYAACFAGIPAIFEECELALFYEGFAAAEALTDRVRRGLTWTKHKHYLTELLKSYRVCTVASIPERDLISQAIPTFENVAIVPNMIDVPAYTHIHAERHPQQLIFTGAFTYNVNYAAAKWFLSEVFPEVLKRNPDVTFVMTGDDAGLELPKVKNATHVGFVDDIKVAIGSAEIVVVPILHGGGTRLKILEAFALGTPVVTTSKGAEGIDAVHGVHLMIADTPAEFAAAIIHLVQNQRLREHLSQAGYELVASLYNWRTTMKHVLDLVEWAAEPSGSMPSVADTTVRHT